MRFVSFFLSFVLFMSMVPAGAYATEANINDDKAGIIAEEPGSSDRIDPADPTLETDPANEDDPDEQVEDPEKITDGDVTEPVDDKKDPDEELEEELPPDDVQRVAHQDDVGVVPDVAGCGAEMDDSLRLRALQPVGVNMGHHIVTHFLLPAFRVLIVDVVRVAFQFRDLLIGDRKPQFLLRLGQRDPEFSPGPELSVRREHFLHLRARVAFRKRTYISVTAHSSSCPWPAGRPASPGLPGPFFIPARRVY